jgi:chromosome segregation protein
MGLISRRSELDALKTQIAEVDRRVESLSTQVAQGNAQAKALQEQQNTLRNSIYNANTHKVQTTSRISQNTDKQTSFRRELPVLERELQNYLDQVGRLKTEESTLREKRQAIDSEQTTRQQQVEDLAKKQSEGAETLKACGESLTALRVQVGQVQEKQIASEQSVQRLSAAKSELAEQLERIARSAESLSSRRSSVEAELAAAEQSEKQLAHKQDLLTRKIEELSTQVADLQTRVTSVSADVDAAAKSHQEVEQSLHHLALQISEVRVRIENLAQRTLDELQLDLPARYAELDQQGGYQPADMDWAAVADEIKQLRDKIQRLGNVNLDAIGEQDELEKRQEFLSTQVTDLTTSKQQLEELIDQINKESSARFEQTFNAVREHFKGMFRKLFGGGNADIFLETSLEDDSADQQPTLGPDGQTVLPIVRKTIDPLEAGIEIIAKPPGKQPVSISQLSGGEKTMTCVALLMSIFKSKPSPFCILDEVDAALDEANNQRFNLIVQEFLDQSQFIIITHSKRTMQIADVLYGVTMQEQGVSKRVAVRFDQVDSEGRINEPDHAAA